MYCKASALTMLAGESRFCKASSNRNQNRSAGRQGFHCPCKKRTLINAQKLLLEAFSHDISVKWTTAPDNKLINRNHNRLGWSPLQNNITPTNIWLLSSVVKGASAFIPTSHDSAAVTGIYRLLLRPTVMWTRHLHVTQRMAVTCILHT